MSNVLKPRFHDEECYGHLVQGKSETDNSRADEADKFNTSSCAALTKSAQVHFSNQNVKAGVDDIIAAYERLAEDRARLTELRNLVFRGLSTSEGWQAAPHPQALRLRRLTPSIPLRSISQESLK